MLCFRIDALAVLNWTCSRIRIWPRSMRTMGQPFWAGSALGGPAASGQASSWSTIVSPSRSFGVGQPFFSASAEASPGSCGQASSASGMPSPSVSGGGGAGAGAAIGGSGGGSADWERGLAAGGGRGWSTNAGQYSRDARTRMVGDPGPSVRPGPTPAPTRQSGATATWPSNRSSAGVAAALPNAARGLLPYSSEPSRTVGDTRQPSANPPVISSPGAKPELGRV